MRAYYLLSEVTVASASDERSGPVVISGSLTRPLSTQHHAPHGPPAITEIPPMLRRFFTRREANYAGTNHATITTRRSRRSRPGIESLEGKQLLSLATPFQIDSPSQPAAAKDWVVSSTNSNGWSVDAWVQQPVLTNGRLGAMEIMAQLYNSSGAKVGPEIVAAASGQGYNSYEPSVSIGPQNSYVLSWTQQESSGNTFVLAQEFNSQSVAIGNVVPVGVGTFYQYESSVAMFPFGGFVVTYTRDTNDNNPDVFAKDYYSNEQLRTVITVAASSLAESNPTIAMDPEGNFDIAYQVKNGSKTTVDLARYTDVDSLLGTMQVTTGSASDDLPSLAIDDSDDAVIAYRESIGTNSYAVYATEISQGISPKAKVFIGDYGPTYFYEGPSVAMPSSGGEFAVAYDHWSSSGAESLDVAVVGSANTVTKRYDVGSNDYSPSITSLPSDTGEFRVSYVTTASSGSNNHVFGRLGTYS
jgi:hypothetical protein